MHAVEYATSAIRLPWTFIIKTKAVLFCFVFGVFLLEVSQPFAWTTSNITHL